MTNKCLETHPRRPYLPRSTQGIERAIFRLQIHLFSLPMLRSAAPSLSAICLTLIYSSACSSLCLCISLRFFQTFSVLGWWRAIVGWKKESTLLNPALWDWVSICTDKEEADPGIKMGSGRIHSVPRESNIRRSWYPLQCSVVPNA